MSKEREILSLELDWSIIDACNGFTFDMGGSVMKIVYVDKDDYIEPSMRKENSKGTIRMINFSRKELDEAFEFIKNRVRIPPGGPEPRRIFTTGLGGSQFQEKLQETTGVKNINLMEMDCFTQAFHYLAKHVPKSQMLYPFSKEMYEKAIEAKKRSRDALLSMKGTSVMIDMAISRPDFGKIHFQQYEDEMNPELTGKTLAESDKDLFPCGLMMCGSAFGFILVKENGKQTFMTMSSRGGKMLLGLGSLLCKTKTFEEFMSLCEKGSALNVSGTSKSVLEGIKSTDENDVYGKWKEMVGKVEKEEEVVFCFGKADGKVIEDFSREDLARCIFETMIHDVVQIAFDNAYGKRLKHVFFCGGFVNHPFARQLISKQWLSYSERKKQFNQMEEGGNHDVHFHFLLHGQSLGALGALLNHKLKWMEKQREELEQMAVMLAKKKIDDKETTSKDSPLKEQKNES